MKQALFGLLAALSLAGAAQAEEPLKIGVLEDMTGAYSDVAGDGSVVAARLAIEDFGGTVLGRKIELLSGDHQNKADVGANVARQWFEADGVRMIAGIGNSAVAIATHDIARATDRIDIASSAASPVLSNEHCSPNGFQWNYTTYSNAKMVASTVVAGGGKTWFFLTTDYTFGTSIQNDMTRFIEAAGGKVVGSVRMPLNNQDFASYLLQAQSSGAQIVGIAAAGSDLVTSIKQAGEFGLVAGGQAMSATVGFVQDIHTLGLDVAQGLYIAEPFYWDTDDATRAWSARFEALAGKKPNGNHAAAYSSVLHYLKAVKAAGTVETAKVLAAMHAAPVEDFYTHGARIRADGLVMRDLHLFQVKKPVESAGEWDVYRLVATSPGSEAYWPVAESKCPLLKGAQ
jgi:branched-chain amino acid transport system substrate-binding protein